MERMIYAYGRELGLDYTIVRPFNFIGARMDFLPGIDGEGIPRVVPCFMTALLKNRPLQLVEGGLNRRAFTYIGDAIDACMKILAKKTGARREIFNIGNPDNETTMAELAKSMVGIWKEIAPEKMRNRPEPQIKSVSAQKFYGEGYEDCDRRVPDITKARSKLGWNPKVSLDNALRLTMQAYLDQYEQLRTTR
jgi:UDP-apiose/xylose synthase